MSNQPSIWSENEILDYEPDLVQMMPVPAAPKPSRPPRRRKHRVRPYVPHYPDLSLQMFNHRYGIGVLSLRDNAFCLTNGVISHVCENDPRLFARLQAKLFEMQVSTLYITDNESRIRWRILTKDLDGKDTLFRITVVTLRNTNGKCSVCFKNCIRASAIGGYEALTKVKVDPIPH